MQKLNSLQCWKKLPAMQCQCPSLRTVSFVVGGMNILFAALLTIRVLVHLAVYNHIEVEIAKKDKAAEEEIQVGLATLISLLLIAVVWLASSFLLVKGIHQERYKLMSWWIYFNYVLMAVVFGSACVAFISDCIHWTSFGHVLGKLVLYVLVSGTSFLIFYPVFLLYKRMQINTEQQALRDSEPCKPSTPDTRVADFYRQENQRSDPEQLPVTNVSELN